MKMNDLNIGTQLKIGFGIIVFLILILGVISWQQSDKIVQQATTLYEHPLKVRRAISELKIDILSIRLYYRDLLTSKNEQERQNSIVNISLHQADAEFNFGILSNQYLGPKADIEEAHKAFLLWISMLEADKDLAQSGKITEALRRFEANGDIGRERELMLKSVKKIDEFAINKANQIYNKTVELKVSLERRLTIVVAWVLALALLIIALLVRNIHRPIKELNLVTKLFSEGKFDSRSSYVSKNEFGMLANSFNSLAKTIQEEFTFKDRSVRLNSFMLKDLESHSFRQQVLEPLMKLTNSQVGAIYLLNDQKTMYEHFESIGLDSTVNKSFSAQNFEGEFGTVLATKKIAHITNIPAETQFSLTTVSGVLRPKAIITIPLIDKKEIISMISLSSLQGYDSIAIRLVTDTQGALTAWMNAMISNRKIVKMSESLTMQNHELEAQKKELATQAGELLEQNTELEMQKIQLAESNQLKSSFLSNMSHELRTPLNSVIALSGVLNRRLHNKIPADEYSYLNVIERNGKQLLTLINDILDLSRIEAGYEELAISTFKIDELIHEVVDLIRPQAKQKRINLTYFPDSELPVMTCDFEKCRHILQNIVANAIKFTEKGEVVIVAKADVQTIRIEVKDTGIGIEKEFLSQIFDEFRQADSSNARKHGGTGLGLSIAKKYAAFLGGSITVESERGKGSTFTLILPLQPKKDQVIEEQEVIRQTIDLQNLEQDLNEVNSVKKTILLVEDTEAIIVQLKDMLQSQGYEISVARNGNEALEQIAVNIPDALVLDLMMPEVDGFEVLRCIREKEETAHLPVVILTAKYVTKEELAFLKHNNVHQLIQKGDINKNQLLNAVARMMYPEKNNVSQADEKPKPKPNLNLPSNIPVILVVEDNPDNLLTIKALLSGYGEIIEANDGTIGIEMALQHLPHLILMDIALPGINGIETLQKLRNEESLKQIPVVAVSASAMKGDREQLIENGFDDYISKPIDNNVFIQVVKKWTGRTI